MHKPVIPASERQERVLRQLLALRRALCRQEVAPEWVVMSVCTTLEAACSELLENLLKDHASRTSSPLERDLIKNQKSEMNKSWINRLKWLSTGFSIKLDALLEQELLALIELRNAIAHNGQSFTPRQLAQYHRFVAQRRILETSFGVSFRGATFIVSPITGDKALHVGREVTAQLLA